MATFTNHVAIAAPRNGTTTHTVSPSSGTVVGGSLFTPTAGRLLVCVVEGPVTSTTPAGWTLPTGGAAVGNSGLYVWYRDAAGGDSLTTTHNASNYAVVFHFFEFAVGSTFIDVASNTTGAATGGAGPTLSGLSTSVTSWRAGVYARSDLAVNTAGSGFTLTWATGTELVEYVEADGATDGYQYGLTYLEAATATQAFTATAVSPGGTGTAERMVFAVNAVDGGGSGGQGTATGTTTWTGTATGPSSSGSTTRLWPATNGPATVANDPDNYTLGTEFNLVPGTVGHAASAVYLWRPADAPATTCSVGIYEVTGSTTGTLLGSVADVAIPAFYNGWYRVELTTPVDLVAGVSYVAAVNSSTNSFYAATPAYWSTGAGAAGVTNGVLRAPASGGQTSAGQGSFTVGATLAFPTGSFNATNYWIDVEVTGPSGGQGAAVGTTTWTGTAAGPVVPSLSIADENALTGRARNLWYDGVGSTQMPAFARSTYYEPGQTAEFSVNFNSAFTFDVIRLGHYSDAGGRRVAGPISGTPASQPAPAVIANSNGAVDCAAWSKNVTWSIPADATPGWYYLYLTDGSSNFGHALFCVTDKQAKKPVLAITGDATWHAAYNGFGGNNVYGNTTGVGNADNRALCSSYDKPVISLENVPQTHFFNASWASFKYLESLGVEVGYATVEQINNDPTIMDDREVIIFSGHNEYVPQPMMNKTKALLAAGQKIVNWAGNDFFWRVKLGSPAGMNTPGRVMWCKKDTLPGPIGGHTAGTPFTTEADWTGTWQDTRWSLREPTTEFMGDRFIANGIRNDSVKVPFAMKTSPLWRDCAGVQALTSGQDFTFGAGSLGMEWDFPEGSLEQVRLSSTVVDLTSNASDANGQNYNLTVAAAEHSITATRSGAGLVINFNSDQWGKTLDNFNIRHGNIANANARQACLNVLVDLGAAVDSAMVASASLVEPTPLGVEPGVAYGLASTEPYVPAEFPYAQAARRFTVGLRDPLAWTARPGAAAKPVVEDVLFGATSGAATVAAVPLATAAVVGVASVSSGSRAAATVLATAAVVGAATVGAGARVVTAAHASTSAVGVPAVSTGARPVAAVHPTAATVGVSAVSTGVRVSATAHPSTSAVPSASVSLTANQVVVAAVVATTSSVGAVAVTASAAAAAATHASAAAVGAPAVSTGARPTPAAHSSTSAVGVPAGVIESLVVVASHPTVAAFGAPTVTSVAGAAPATLATAATVGVPVVRAASTATPTTLARSSSFGAPAVTTSARVLAATVTTTSNVGAPGVQSAGNANVATDTHDTTTAFGAAAAQAGARVAVVTLARAAVVGAPSLRIASLILAASHPTAAAVGAAVARSAAFPTPAAAVTAAGFPVVSLRVASLVLAAGHPTAAAVPAPAVRTSTRPAPATVATTSGFGVPAVLSGSGALVAPPPLSTTASFGAPSVTVSSFASAGTVETVAVVSLPVIVAGVRVVVGAVATTSTFGVPYIVSARPAEVDLDASVSAAVMLRAAAGGDIVLEAAFHDAITLAASYASAVAQQVLDDTSVPSGAGG